jgi:transcriptional regulator, propionate catabolism operon regulatory protein
MNIRVLVIAPYQGLTEVIKSLEPQLAGFEIVVHKADLVESLNLLENYREEPFDFIISRGGTADMLRESASLPIIDIEVSGYDILRILTLLKGYQQKVGMIGFKKIIQGFESVSALIDMDIVYTAINHKDEVADAVQQAKENGVKIIVGDTITVRLAGEMGLQGVLITSGKESILEAFDRAKQMYAVQERLTAEASFYCGILNRLESAVALVNEEGDVCFSNDSFNQVIPSAQGNSLFASHPYFQKIAKLVKRGMQFPFQLSVAGRSGLYDINADYISDGGSKPLYHFELKRAEVQKKREMNIIFPHNNHDGYPKLLLSADTFKQAIETGKKRVQAGLPVAVTGESGTGKGLFVEALFKTAFPEGGTHVEVELGSPGVKSFNQLLKLLESETEGTLVHLRGIENASIQQQQRLCGAMGSVRASLVFSFIDSALINDAGSQLDEKLLEILREESVHFLPLRERGGELEEMIHSFIVQFNERYGKQIAGVRPPVLEALQAHRWNANLTELKQVIEQFVKLSEDAYITEEVLPLLDGYGLHVNGREGVQGAFINLNQPLDQIEAEIIDRLMHEENMNQSRVAKRLGINRSTLWRKLNNK